MWNLRLKLTPSLYFNTCMALIDGATQCISGLQIKPVEDLHLSGYNIHKEEKWQKSLLRCVGTFMEWYINKGQDCSDLTCCETTGREDI